MISRRNQNSRAKEDVGNWIGSCWDSSEYYTAWCCIQAEVGGGYYCMSLSSAMTYSDDIGDNDGKAHTYKWAYDSVYSTDISKWAYKCEGGTKLTTVHNCDVMIREDVSYPKMTLLTLDHRGRIHRCPTGYEKVHSSFNGNQQDRWSVHGDFRCFSERRRR